MPPLPKAPLLGLVLSALALTSSATLDARAQGKADKKEDGATKDDAKKDDAKKDDAKKDDDGPKKKDDDDDDKPAPKAEPAPEPKPEPKPEKKGPPRARWHPDYSIEIEAHGTVAAFDAFFVGLGGGMRLTIPVADNALVKSIDDEISLGIGLDIVRYGAYKPINTSSKPGLGVLAFYVPVSLQWNFWLGSRATFFLEPTLIYRYATYIDECNSAYGSACAERTKFLPSGAIGMRFRFANHIGMTLRAGWPMANLGLTWL